MIHFACQIKDIGKCKSLIGCPNDAHLMKKNLLSFKKSDYITYFR